MTLPTCVRRVQDDSGLYRQCRRRSDVEYLVDPDGGLADRPRAYLCRAHARPAPRGYLRRVIR